MAKPTTTTTAATTRKKPEPIDPNETAPNRFKRVASRRLGEIVHGMELLGNCAATETYEYTPAQVANINRIIDEAVAKMKTMYASGGKKEAKQGITL